MVGNKLLTFFSNMLTNINLTDMETCYKMVRREIIQKIKLEENRFGFEPEITAKLAKSGCRIFEVGIGYSGRTYQEGKKINWKDGFRAIYAIIKYNLFRWFFAATKGLTLETFNRWLLNSWITFFRLAKSVLFSFKTPLIWSI